MMVKIGNRGTSNLLQFYNCKTAGCLKVLTFYCHTGSTLCILGWAVLTAILEVNKKWFLSDSDNEFDVFLVQPNRDFGKNAFFNIYPCLLKISIKIIIIFIICFFIIIIIISIMKHWPNITVNHLSDIIFWLDLEILWKKNGSKIYFYREQ